MAYILGKISSLFWWEGKMKIKKPWERRLKLLIRMCVVEHDEYPRSILGAECSSNGKPVKEHKA